MTTDGRADESPTRDEPPPAGEHPRTLAGGETRSRRRPVLVVDDDPLILGFVAQVLGLEGHDVLTAGGGPEALRLVYGGMPTPALLIADVDMPGMSGIELAARLTADRPTVPIVLMTGHPAMKESALERPELVRAVLLKPFDVEELLATVRTIIETPHERPSPAQ